MEENKMNKFKIFSLVAGTLSFVIILIIGIVGIHISVDGFAGGTQHETISMFKNSSDGSIASNYSTTLGVALFFGVVALVLGIVSAFVKGKAVIALVSVELAMICLTYVIISFGVFELKTDVNDLDGWYYYTNDPENDFFVDFNCDSWSVTITHLLNFVQFGVGLGFTIACVVGTSRMLKGNAPATPKKLD
jgi:hypothetical protein